MDASEPLLLEDKRRSVRQLRMTSIVPINTGKGWDWNQEIHSLGCRYSTRCSIDWEAFDRDENRRCEEYSSDWWTSSLRQRRIGSDPHSPRTSPPTSSRCRHVPSLPESAVQMSSVVRHQLIRRSSIDSDYQRRGANRRPMRIERLSGDRPIVLNVNETLTEIPSTCMSILFNRSKTLTRINKFILGRLIFSPSDLMTVDVDINQVREGKYPWVECKSNRRCSRRRLFDGIRKRPTPALTLIMTLSMSDT